jgi:hypothetical protein
MTSKKDEKNMTCSKCKNKSIDNVEYAGKHYCDRHFLELMEKRVRKNLRVNIDLDVKLEYALLDDNSSEFHLTKYFLEKIFNKHLMLKFRKTMPKNSSSLIVPTNLDEQVIIFLDEFLKNNKLNDQTKIKTSKNKNHEIMPLEVLQQKEVELLCEILKIKFVPRVKTDILKELEKKHPGTKFSLFKSRQNLSKFT